MRFTWSVQIRKPDPVIIPRLYRSPSDLPGPFDEAARRISEEKLDELQSRHGEERERQRILEKKEVEESDISKRSADPVPSFRVKHSSATNASPIFSRRFFAPVISTLICPIILLPLGKRAQVKAINLSRERTHPRVSAREYIPAKNVKNGESFRTVRICRITPLISDLPFRRASPSIIRFLPSLDARFETFDEARR